MGDVSLRWEQHTEFTSYTWDFAGAAALEASALALAGSMMRTPQPGPLLACVDLRITSGEAPGEAEQMFDPSAVAMARMENGDAVAATDFKADADGFVRIVLVNQRLTDHRLGALVQRLLELETYRMLALIALPDAQRLEPFVRNIEQELPEITRGIMEGEGVASNQQLLDRLISLAAHWRRARPPRSTGSAPAARTTTSSGDGWRRSTRAPIQAIRHSPLFCPGG